ncbi:Polar tube protein 3 [Cucumispora dikerogammari]|nr:Polar tube protein 3 [Cucumispora dikerogammari]
MSIYSAKKLISMLNTVTSLLKLFIHQTPLTLEHVPNIYSASKHNFKRPPSSKGKIPIIVPTIHERDPFKSPSIKGNRASGLETRPFVNEEDPFITPLKETEPYSPSAKLNFTELELSNLNDMYKNEKDIIERENAAVEAALREKKSDIISPPVPSSDTPSFPVRNINDFNALDASVLQTGVNNPDLTLEDLQKQIKDLRAASPEIIKTAEAEALQSFYTANPDAEPAEALLAAQIKVEDVENQLKLREQQLIHQMDAIKDNIRVSDASHEAGRAFAEQNPQAKESELLKHQYLVAQETQQKINEEREQQALAEIEGQKVFNKALEEGALKADAAKEAEKEKEKTKSELSGKHPSQGMPSFFDPSLQSPFYDEFGIPAFPTNTKPIILDEQIFIQDRLPAFISDTETVNQLANNKISEGKEAEDILKNYIQHMVGKKGFPLQRFLEDAFSSRKRGDNPWDILEKYFSPFEDPVVNEAFTGLRNTFPDFGTPLLNHGIANAKPSSELLQTLAQQNIGQQFGLTEEEKNSLLKQGKTPAQIEDMNEQIITENRLTNTELLNTYAQDVQSGNLHDNLIKQRTNILERIHKNPSTENIDDRIKHNEILKQQLGMEKLPILSQEAQERGDRVYEEILEQSGDPSFAKEMAQKSAMAYENRLNEEKAFVDSKKASADVFEATNVIEVAKDFITKEDAKTIKEAQKIKHLEPGLLDAERAKQEAESAEAIQQEIEKLRILEMEHKVQAEELAIQSNLKHKKAQQLEELSHATDIIQTEEILSQEREDRIKNLGIKKVLEDDETVLTLKNAGLNFPLKTFGEVEAADEEEYKIMQSQEELKEDLKNTITETHFDSALNVIKTDDGFLNVGENASKIEVKKGEVIYPFSAQQEMKKRGLDTKMLEKKTNKGEQTNMATGIVYYSAPIENGTFDLPRPLNPTPSHVIVNDKGEQIDTLFAQSMTVSEGRLILEPMSSYKNNIRPRVNKALNVEKTLSVEQQAALEELKQKADEIEQTQVQVFENPDGTRVVKMTKPFGETSTMSTEKAIDKEGEICVKQDFISFNVADLEDGPKISDDLTMQVFTEALAEGKVEDASFVQQFLSQHGGNEELVAKLEEQVGFEGMEQVIEQNGEKDQAQAGSQTETSTTETHGGTITQGATRGGSETHGETQSGSETHSGTVSGSSVTRGGSTQTHSVTQSGGETHTSSVTHGGTQHGQTQTQTTQMFNGTKVNKSPAPPSSSSAADSHTTTAHKTTEVVTYGNPPLTSHKPTQASQTIQVEQTSKPTPNSEIKRKITYNNNAKIGDVAKKFDPAQGIPGISKAASLAYKDIKENGVKLDKANNLEEGTTKRVVDELPLKVFQEFENNMNNFGQGDDTLSPKEPTLPFNHPLNNIRAPQDPKHKNNHSNLKDPSLPPNHPVNLSNQPSKHRSSLETINAITGGQNTSKIEDILYDALAKQNNKPNPKKITKPTAPVVTAVQDLGNGKVQVKMKKPDEGFKKIEPNLGRNVGKQSIDDKGKPCTFDLSGKCVPNNDYNQKNIIKQDKFFGSEEDKKKMDQELKNQNNKSLPRKESDKKPVQIVVKGPVSIKQNPST